MRWQLKRSWKKMIAVVAAGIAVSVLLKIKFGTAGGVFFSDMLFNVGMSFFVWGLIHLISNMGMFNSMKYGVKTLLRMIMKRKKASEDHRQAYMDYVSSRPRHEDIPVIMLVTAGFISLSALVAFLSST